MDSLEVRPRSAAADGTSAALVADADTPANTQIDRTQRLGSTRRGVIDSTASDGAFRRLRYVIARFIEKAPRTIGPLFGIGNAHTCGDPDPRTVPSRAHVERLARQVGPVERPRNAHCARESARTVEATAGCETPGGLASADEHSMSPPGATARNVEAVMHAVDEKYICMALLAQKCPCPLRQPSAGVACPIARPAVCLRFDDARCARPCRRRLLMYENASDQRSSRSGRLARVPGSRQTDGSQCREVERGRRNYRRHPDIHRPAKKNRRKRHRLA